MNRCVGPKLICRRPSSNISWSFDGSVVRCWIRNNLLMYLEIEVRDTNSVGFSSIISCSNSNVMHSSVPQNHNNSFAWSFWSQIYHLFCKQNLAWLVKFCSSVPCQDRKSHQKTTVNPSPTMSAQPQGASFRGLRMMPLSSFLPSVE